MNEPDLVAAIATHGEDYTPRTHHLHPDGSPIYTNRLILESSPYLLQHAHNPVDWRPWGDAAFEQAAARNVPLFVSIGYSTCHWCHVMERESFEDIEVAEVINRRYVAVKIDREERPDVDAVFMEFIQATTGRGGWPMSLWLAPDRVPLFGGTYFPARDGDRGVGVGFVTLLGVIADRWEEPRFKAQGQRIMAALAERATDRGARDGLPSGDAVGAATQSLWSSFDRQWGGFGEAPKFPRPAAMNLLLARWHRHGDSNLLEAVEVTLRKMFLGGVYDHVGGGFARYSTDRRWLVPHFEKMLYDNGQLVTTYVRAWQATGDPLYRHVASDVLDYLAREMSDPAGGFYSATDADSEGVEGKFFVWTTDELVEALGRADGDWVAEVFGATPQGNFEGSTILHLDAPLEGPDLERWERLRQRLRRARAERVPPGLDDKVLTSWNALAISAFARAGFAFHRRHYVERAVRAAEFIFEEMARPDGRLRRSWRRGQLRHDGVLEDHAAMLVACLDLLEATQDPRWLRLARGLAETLDTWFVADSGAFHRTATDAEALPMRPIPVYDGAEPSGNALAVEGLLRLGLWDPAGPWSGRARRVLAGVAGAAEGAPMAMPQLLLGLDFLQAAAVQVVLVGDVPEVLATLRATFIPHGVIAFGEGLRRVAADLFEGRDAVGAYVCRGTQCSLPTRAGGELRRLLAATPPPARPPA